jgi:ubiquitin-protein ligase
MTFTDKYPLKAPRVQFLTRIFHPNISTSGEICLDVLRDEKW